MALSEKSYKMIERVEKDIRRLGRELKRFEELSNEELRERALHLVHEFEVGVARAYEPKYTLTKPRRKAA
jgi:hypothetical protein